MVPVIVVCYLVVRFLGGLGDVIRDKVLFKVLEVVSSHDAWVDLVVEGTHVLFQH
jgi:hypothetical protein